MSIVYIYYAILKLFEIFYNKYELENHIIFCKSID